MKKLTSILLALVLLFSLSACGGNQSSESLKTSPKVDNTPSKSPSNMNTNTPDAALNTASDDIVPPLGTTVAPDQLGNTPGNLANYAYAAISGDWIYYTVCMEYGESTLKRIRTDSKGEAEMAKTSWVRPFIQVLGDWVYYLAENENGIHKIRVDGKEQASVIDGPIRCFCSVGDWIYYDRGFNEDITESGIYKIRNDGTENTKLSDNRAINIFVDDDWVYLQGNSEFNKIRTNGTEETELSINVDSSDVLFVENGWIYRSSQRYGTSLISATDESEFYILLPVELNGAKSINISEGWLYVNYGSSIHKRPLTALDRETMYNEDGELIEDALELITLSDDIDCNQINIVGDWIYISSLNNYRIHTDGTGKQKIE